MFGLLIEVIETGCVEAVVVAHSLGKKGRERYRGVPTGAACYIFDRQVAQGGSGGALAATREVRAEDGNIPGDKAKGNARGREGPDIAVDESW